MGTLGVVCRKGACNGALLAVTVWMSIAGPAWAGGNEAQSTPAKLPAFEVVSIKPFQLQGERMMFGIHMMPDGISIHGVPLQMLLRLTFDVSEDRLLNEPGWAKSTRFDIEAKVGAADVPALKNLDNQQRWAMMLPVLEDRFGLKFHHATKKLEVYALVVAKGGVKMKQTAAPAPGGKPEQRMGWFRTSTKGMEIGGNAVPTSFIANAISQQLGSTVVDKTGLKSRYDFKLDWTPEMGPKEMLGGPPEGAPPGGDAATADSNGPSLFTAVQEQLGLKLVARKEPVDVVVIDHIGQPTPN